MSYIGAPLTSTNFVCDTFTATAAQDEFVLSQAPASSRSILVVIDGVVQEPDVAFTLSGSTVTLSEGLLGGEKVYVLHLGIRAVVQAPADGSVTEDSFESELAALLPYRRLETAITTTSGTSHDFTGIPSWAKKVTVMLNGLSTNGTSNPLVQLGHAGGIEATGYTASGSAGATTIGTTNFTAGFGIRQAVSTDTCYGALVLTLMDASTNLWVAHGVFTINGTTHATSAGVKTLSGALDRIRITTVNGTDTFDAGNVNLLIEG